MDDTDQGSGTKLIDVQLLIIICIKYLARRGPLWLRFKIYAISYSWIKLYLMMIQQLINIVLRKRKGHESSRAEFAGRKDHACTSHHDSKCSLH